LSKNLAISPDPERPLYEPSKRRLTRPNGAVATTYSADEPERLRGPQHDAAWCDELAAWRYPEAWDMCGRGATRVPWYRRRRGPRAPPQPLPNNFVQAEWITRFARSVMQTI
jgi:phage terminase large subunit-like protein